ncbi:MAG: hypothetical protein EVJ48_02870 [Candidatus Acidulodesulfobacterium acidiphilum]|uniref:Uncharacterized protein n=1 Tax=Candidatus Acidulodesulfobacterium acidiphilum TaxID=2597224 RepID=A0A520XFB9_9DELT|nr:MAG: hypothetical protein EVJ48_02870 [Candidatus Acidulodesulfobacterium acidiphilum]
MDILEKLVKKDKQIILTISRGQGQDLELDIYTKGGLTITKTDEMMLKNINVFEMLDREDYILN